MKGGRKAQEGGTVLLIPALLLRAPEGAVVPQALAPLARTAR
jgi:hypothetical protein